MYQGKRRIMNPERHEEYRSQAISFRGGAIFNAFIDLEDIINKSLFCEDLYESLSVVVLSEAQ